MHNIKEIRNSLDLFKDSLKKRFLDIDCRTGNGTVFYSKNKKINKAVCITPSSDFLNVCKKRLKKYNIKAKVMLLRELPLKLKSNYFDLILCLETIEHISPKRRLDFLKELNRLIKDRGKMVLSMPNILWEPVHWGVAIFGIHHSEGPHKFLSRREIKRLFEQSNFKIIKQETTVLIPVGSKWLTSFGEILEKSFKNTLMPLIGLRRIYICEKIK